MKKVIDYFEEHPFLLTPRLPSLLTANHWLDEDHWCYDCPGWNEEKESLGDYLGTSKSFVEMYTGDFY